VLAGEASTAGDRERNDDAVPLLEVVNAAADFDDFAGLEYEFGPGFTAAGYTVQVMKAR